MFCCLHIKYVSYIYIRRNSCSHMFRFRTKLFAWACGLVARQYSRAHLCHNHTTSRLEWSSRTMSYLEGNPSAASSSVVASSAANSSSVEAGGSAASSSPGSNPVDVGEPPVAVLQPPNTAETTVSENNKSFSVTIQPPMAGRRKLTAWVWRYVSRFAPTINDKTFCAW